MIQSIYAISSSFMSSIYVTSTSLIKREAVEEYTKFFPDHQFIFMKARTRVEQPLDDMINKCIADRTQYIINQVKTFEEGDLILTLENGILTSGPMDVCQLYIHDPVNDKVIFSSQSFGIQINPELWTQYYENVCMEKTTFGTFLSQKYPVLHNNWVSNYRFGGIDRKEQIRHVMGQWILTQNTRLIENYPKKGVLFKDMTTILTDAPLLNLLCNQFRKMIERNYQDVDYFAGVESRGYYLATILAKEMNRGFIPIRKAKKLPPADIIDIATINYGTEYSTDSIGIIKDKRYNGKNVVIIDDLIATGGSLAATRDLLLDIGMNVLGSAVVYCVEPLLIEARQNVNTLVLMNSDGDLINGYIELDEPTLCQGVPTFLDEIECNLFDSQISEHLSPTNTKIISCFGSEHLATSIHCYSKIPMCSITLSHFNNGETRVEITENIRNQHIILVCRTRNDSVNDDFLSMCMILDACNRADVARITVVLPYYPYARSDKKDHPRVPIGAAAIAHIINSFNVDHVISLDLHSGQLQGLIDKGFHNLYIINDMCKYIQKKYLEDNKDQYVLVSPDAGSIKRIEAYGKKLGMDYIVLHKQRDYSRPGTVMRSMIIGDREQYEGKTGLIIDDMADTMGTMTAATKILAERGMTDVVIIVTHGVLTGPAISRINNCDMIKEVVVTNTLPQCENFKKCPKLRIVDCSCLITRAIIAIADGGSVSALFG